MKRLFTVLIVFALSFSLGNAQQALDFAFLDTEGNKHSLQHALDQGFIVLLDFFFVDCPPCQSSAPELASIAADYAGKNVVLMSFSDRDNNIEINNFADTFNLNFPAAGIEGAGDDVINLYADNFTLMGFPTISVVCPDGSINWDIWPYTEGAPEWRNAIEACGVVDSEPYVSLDGVNVKEIVSLESMSIMPNPVKDISELSLNFTETNTLSVELYNAQGAMVSKVFNGQLSAGQHSITLDLSNLPSGAYWVRLQNATGQTSSQSLQKF